MLPDPLAALGGGEEKGKGGEGRIGKGRRGSREKQGRGGVEGYEKAGEGMAHHFLGQVYAPEKR